MISMATFGQQFECLDSTNKFEHFKPPVDFRFKVFTNSTIPSEQSQLTLEIIPEEQAKYDYLIDGIRLHLTNWSDSTIRTKVSFLDIILICQVSNNNGEWFNIESPLPESYCSYGIEYFEIALNKGDYLKLKAPCYKGQKKVNMRYKLRLKDIIVYSNEIEGYINSELLN